MILRILLPCLPLLYILCSPLSASPESQAGNLVTIDIMRMLEAFSRDEPYEVEGLGVFTALVRRPYAFTHWKSGNKVNVPARAILRFTADVELKEELQIKLRARISSHRIAEDNTHGRVRDR